MINFPTIIKIKGIIEVHKKEREKNPKVMVSESIGRLKVTNGRH
jgi:hypothetical protein